ncbi:MAG: hypothetical protein KAT00_11195 [Planctomycetes bacterium]|nr:hypothetical protein [Planctomycetota bacterium]
MNDDTKKEPPNRLRANKILKLLAIGAMLFIFFYIFDDMSWKSQKTDRIETIKIGNQIIESIDRYRSVNKRYPESLGLLKEVPNPKLGKVWLYKTSKDGQEYELLTGHKKRDGSYGPALYYTSENNSPEWLYFDRDDSIELK